MLHLTALSLVLLQAPAPAQPPAAAPAQPAPATPIATPLANPPATPAQPYPPAQPAQPYPSAQPEPQAQPAQPAQPDPQAQPYYPPPQQYPANDGQPGYPPPYPYSPYPPPQTDLPKRGEPGGAPEFPEDVTHRKLVFVNTFGLTFNVAELVPSGSASFFLGTNLRPRKNLARTFDWNTALGYQLTLSFGGADIPTYEAGEYAPYFGLFVHRHHFAAHGIGGKNQRLYYSLGGGAWFVQSQLAGIEAEGKLGYVFSRPEGRRIKGIVGGQARLGGAFEGVPLPQFGVFIGYMIF